MKKSVDFVFSDDDYDIDERYGKVRLGLCCMNNELRKKNIFCSRTTPRSHYSVEKAKDLSLKNIADIETLVKWNYEHGIYVFRLSSDIFPHYTDLEVEPYDMKFADEALRKAGEVCRFYQQRIVMHPGQFNQIGAKTEETFQKTCDDLDMHAEMLDRMGIDESEGVLTIHGGGTYGDKEKTMRRWVEQFSDLPSRVKRRVAVENCEKCYCVRDCLCLAEQTRIPVIFDSHHYTCYNHFHKDEEQETQEDLMGEVVETWKGRGRMLCHISDQKEGAPVGAHSDFISTIPKFFLNAPLDHNIEIDIEVEAKAKEAAVMDLYSKHSEVFRIN